MHKRRHLNLGYPRLAQTVDDFDFLIRRDKFSFNLKPITGAHFTDIDACHIVPFLII